MAKPTDRPKCGNCFAVLRPWPYQNVAPKRNPFGYAGEGIFCSLRCGYHFGVRVVESRRAPAP